MTQAIITLIGVVATALVTWSIAQRRIVVEQVTAERKRWRNKIRAKASKVHNAILADSRKRTLRLRGEFRALLNPYDNDDKSILKCIEAGGSDECRRRRAEEFEERISYLLKHDWDRAKLEAGFFLFRWTLKVNRRRLEVDAVQNIENREGQSVCRQVGGNRCFREEWEDWWEKYSIRCWPSAALGLAFVAVIAIVIAFLVVRHHGGTVATHEVVTWFVVQGAISPPGNRWHRLAPGRRSSWVDATSPSRTSPTGHRRHPRPESRTRQCRLQ